MALQGDLSMVAVAEKPGLAVSERIQEKLRNGELTQKQVDDFQAFLRRVDKEMMRHRVIVDNKYTKWFQKGEATDQELRHFVKQFSVFSNLFLIAALNKVINAPSLEQMRQSKEILMNELGVIYRKHSQPMGQASGSDEDKDREGDPELVSIEGTVDGGLYRHRAAHYEWLLAVGEGIGLTYKDIGKRKNGRPSTLAFCDGMARLYGSDDPMIAEGASFAVENWAAAGFWQEIEDGLMVLKKARHPKLRLAFFTWHNRVEAQHADHVMDELEETYFDEDFDPEKFFKGGKEVLDSVATFWDGLENDRVNKVYT
jgi:pyrroloquinoline quinone (PQQ) biosynthesis protein C